MADVAKAARLALDCFRFNAAAFYGSGQGRGLGVGLIYDGVSFPLFNLDHDLFDTASGVVYVLTHECDVDAANERNFNEKVLICPVIKFEDLVVEVIERQSEGALFGMIPDLANDSVFRVFYLPPVPGRLGHQLPFGGFLYLNDICSTHVRCFHQGRAVRVCALSSYALRLLDGKLQNHLFRPKAEALPRLN
jgi:hypothetical protein